MKYYISDYHICTTCGTGGSNWWFIVMRVEINNSSNTKGFSCNMLVAAILHNYMCVLTAAD